MSASARAGPAFSLATLSRVGASGSTVLTFSLAGFRACGSWLASAGRWSGHTGPVSRSLLVLFSHTRLFDWFWGAHLHGLQSLLMRKPLVLVQGPPLPHPEACVYSASCRWACTQNADMAGQQRCADGQ